MLSTRAHTTAVYIAFVLLTGWLLWQSSQYPTAQYRSTTTEDRDADHQSVEERHQTTEEAIAYYNKWLMFFTAILAIATIGLGVATIGMYSLAREELLSAHRPKIRIKHLMLANDIWQEEPILVNLTCVNNGTADAILHQVGLRYAVVKKGRVLPIDPAIPAIFNFTGGRLECGRNWTTENINANRTLTPEENADIQQGRSELYCIGYVSYLDASDRMRITGFCRVLTFPEDALADVLHCRWRKFPDPDYEYED